MIRMRGCGEPLKPGEEIVATFGDRAVVSMPTGMMVKRASLCDEGFVLDHYSRRALQVHLDTAGEKLWEAVKRTGIRSFWCDSLERNGRLDRLVSWTEIPSLRHFSGPPAYTAEIGASAPSGLLGPVRLLVSAK